MKRCKAIFSSIFVALMAASNAYAQEGYFCVSEAAGGVSYEKSINKWKGTAFKTNNDKILITKKNNKWVMKQFDLSIENDCSSPNEYGVMKCEKFFGTLIFNTKTLRYLSTYTAGYIDGVDKNDNTPSVEIGACTKL